MKVIQKNPHQQNIEKNLAMKLINRQVAQRKNLKLNDCQLLKWLKGDSKVVTQI